MRENKVEIIGLIKSREYGKTAYIFLMGLLLLSFPYMMVTYTHFVPYQVPLFIWVLRCISSVLAIYIGKLWKDRGFQILFVYLLYILLRTVITDLNGLFSIRFSESILTGIWAFSACYGLAKILKKEELKSCLRISSLIWTLAIAVSCCVGIYAAWRGERIYTAGDAAFWGLYPKRLMIPYLPTVSGALTSLSALIALCAFVCHKNRYIRLAYGIAMVPILLALSLTDSRTGFISFAFGAAVLTFICLSRWKDRTGLETTRKTIVRQKLLAGVVSLLVCAGAVFLLMSAENAFHTLRTRGGLLISNAYAEAAGSTSAARGFSGDSGMLTGRFELWKSTVHYLIHHPLTLLFGAGKADPMAMINPQMAHTHNLPLMILVESGIIGAAILLLFILYVCRNGLREIRKHGNIYPVLLLSVVASIITGDMAECFAWMAAGSFPSLPFLFVIIGIFGHADNGTVIG